MAPLLSTGSQTRSRRRFCIRPTCPLASTTTFARTSRSAPSSPLTRTPHGAAAFQQHVEHAHALVRLDAVLARVVEHHLVELAAHHLPGLRALVRLVVPEVEGRRQLAVRVDELDAVLLDEVALLHLRQHVEPLQHPVGLRDQRLADVEAREALALEELDRVALLGDQRGRGGPGGSAADHHDVGICRCRSVVIVLASSTTKRRAFISKRGRVRGSTDAHGNM